MNPLLLSAIIRSSRESSESSSNSYIGSYKWDFRDYLTMSTFILLMVICFYMLITTSMNFNTYKYYMQYKNVTREEIAEYSNTINNELVKNSMQEFMYIKVLKQIITEKILV